jgi:hypothetical protein
MSGPVRAAGGQQFSVTRDRDRTHVAFVCFKSTQRLAAFDVPGLKRAFGSDGDQRLAVRGDGEAANPFVINGADLGPRQHVPEPNDVVASGSGESFAVGRKRDAEDLCRLAAKGTDLPAGRSFPEAGPEIAAGDEEFAVLAHGKSRHSSPIGVGVSRLGEEDGRDLLVGEFSRVAKPMGSVDDGTNAHRDRKGDENDDAETDRDLTKPTPS